jgi:hypothetical protein
VKCIRGSDGEEKHSVGHSTEGRTILKWIFTKGAKWSDMATDRGKWQTPENMVMKCYINPSVNW